MRVLICGDRYWNDVMTMSNFFALLPDDTEIVHGDCRGADKMADEIAWNRGMRRHPFPAEWKIFGKKAGPIRNQLMLDEKKPELVVAFHDNISSSRGTKDMLKRAVKANVPCLLISSVRSVI